MNRATWGKQMWLCLVTLAMLAGVAWADPSGNANLPQIMEGFTHTGTPGLSRQRTFLTTDSIIFEGIYYDNNVACSGVAPTFAQLFLFNAEGVFVNSFTGATFPTTGGPKYRALFIEFATVAAIPLSPGTYKFTWLVRDCTNGKSIILPELLTFAVFAP